MVGSGCILQHCVTLDISKTDKIQLYNSGVKELNILTRL